MGLWTAITIIAVGCTLIETVASYKKKKLEETSKTNNIALLTQLAMSRPDLQINDLKKMLQLEDNKMKE